MSTEEDTMLCRMSPSRWKEGTMVPTYFVSLVKPRKGHFKRLREAIQQVSPYSRIEIIGGGTFNEKIIIDKPIEIGVGKNSEQPILTYKTAPLTLQADEAFLEGLCIEIYPTVASFSILISKGSPVLRNCVFGSIEVSGNSSPIIEECKIKDSKVNGVSLLEQSGGSFIRNVISSHTGYSVYIESTAAPQFSYNTISGSRQGQILIQGSCGGAHRASTANFSSVTAPSESDVCTESTASLILSPSFLSNRISDDFGLVSHPSKEAEGVLPSYELETLPVKTTGMQVVLVPLDRAARSAVESLESNHNFIGAQDEESPILSNTSERCAILVCGSNANPTFSRNTIMGSLQHGVFLKGNCMGKFESNYVTSNKGWGFIIEGGETCPLLMGNHIASNGGGMRVSGSPCRIINHNALFDNRGPQILVERAHSRFFFEKNIVRSGNSIGVWCRDSGKGTFSSNDFSTCNVCVRIERFADPYFTQNNFEGSNIGVLAHQAARGWFDRCPFNDLSIAGVAVATVAETVFTQCSFTSVVTGILVTRGGRGIFQECTIQDSRRSGIEISERGAPFIQRCRVLSGKSVGIQVSKNGLGVVQYSSILGNDGHQVYISSGGDPIIEYSVIGHSPTDGVAIDNGGCGLLLHNVIQRCYGTGVSVSGSSSVPILRGNSIIECGHCGLHVTGSYLGTYEKNILAGNHRSNITLTGANTSSTRVMKGERASPVGGNKSGVHAYSSLDSDKDRRSRNETKKVQLRGNIIRESPANGVSVEKGASALFVDNIFFNNNVALVARTGSQVFFLRNCVKQSKDGLCIEEESSLYALGNTFREISGSAVGANTGSYMIELYWNLFERCGCAVLARRVANGIASHNVVRRCRSDAIHLGVESHMTISKNILYHNTIGVRMAEMNVKSKVHDNAILYSSEYGISVSGDHCFNAFMESNLVLNSNVGIFLSGTLSKMEWCYNSFINCKVGIRVCAAPLPSMLLPATSSFDPSPLLSNLADGSTAPAATHSSSKATSLAITGPPEIAGAPSIKYSYVSCCSIGGEGGIAPHIATAALEGSINHNSKPHGCYGVVSHTLFCNNDIGFCFSSELSSSGSDGGTETWRFPSSIRGNPLSNLSMNIGSHGLPNIFSFLTLRSCIFSNSASIGVLSHTRAQGYISMCSFFKNFINVAATGSSSTCFHRSILEAPVTFNVYACGLGTTPRFQSCLLTSQAYAVRNGVFGATEELKTTLLLRNAIADITKKHQVMTLSNPGDLKMAFPPKIRRSPLTNISAPSVEEINTDVEISAADQQRLAHVPSLWEDLYDEILYWSPDGANLTDVKMDCSTQEELPFPLNARRSAILWPRNLYSSDGILGGPGGPFSLHRTKVSQNGQQLLDSTKSAIARIIYSYTACGVWIEAEASPHFDQCYFGEHRFVSAAETRLLQPPEDNQWVVNPSVFQNSTIQQYKPPLDCSAATTTLEQLLVCGSPCYWRQHHFSGGPPFYKVCRLFSEFLDGAELSKKIEANSMKTSVALSESTNRSIGKDTFTNFPVILAQHFSTSFTEHLAGTAVLACENAAGAFHRCVFARNLHCAKLWGSSKTLFDRCIIESQSNASFLTKESCQCTIRRCSFRESRFIQIITEGPENHVLIEANDFCGSVFSSIVCRSRSHPEITNNNFRNIATDTIVIETDAAPSILQNHMQCCKCALLYKTGGRGVADQNTLSECTEFGISVVDEATSPLINKNRFTKIKEEAISVKGALARPHVIDNIFTENKIGIYLRAGACGIYEKNLFRHHEYGLIIDQSFGDFRLNRVLESFDSGIFIKGVKSNPRIYRNIIQNGKATAIRALNSQGQLYINEISQNAGDGLIIQGESCQVIFFGNQVDRNRGNGVLIEKGGKPSICCCSITQNKAGGVLVRGENTFPVLEGDYIKGNSTMGITFDADSSGKVIGCAISHTKDGSAIKLGGKSNSFFTELIVFANKDGGLFVSGGAIVKLQECLFISNQSHSDKPAFCLASNEDGNSARDCVFIENNTSIIFEGASKMELFSCSFLGAHGGSNGVAVHIKNGATPRLLHCLFADVRCAISDSGNAFLHRCIFLNANCGIEMVGSSSSISECEFRECAIGVRSVRGQCKVSGSIFSGCNKIGILITEEGNPVVEECSILRSQKAVLAQGEAKGKLRANRIFWNYENVTISDNATTELLHNLIFDGENYGLCVKGSSKPMIFGNDIFDNLKACVILESAAGGKMEDNKFSFPRDDGAVVADNPEASKLLMQSNNTLRNNFSPLQNAAYRGLNERNAAYRRLENDKEKDATAYVRLRDRTDETLTLVFLKLTAELTAAIENNTSAMFKEWLLNSECDDSSGTQNIAHISGTDTKWGDPFTLRWQRLPGDFIDAAIQIASFSEVQANFPVSGEAASQHHGENVEQIFSPRGCPNAENSPNGSPAPGSRRKNKIKSNVSPPGRKLHDQSVESPDINNSRCERNDHLGSVSSLEESFQSVEADGFPSKNRCSSKRRKKAKFSSASFGTFDGKSSDNDSEDEGGSPVGGDRIIFLGLGTTLVVMPKKEHLFDVPHTTQVLRRAKVTAMRVLNALQSSNSSAVLPGSSNQNEPYRTPYATHSYSNLIQQPHLRTVNSSGEATFRIQQSNSTTNRKKSAKNSTYPSTLPAVEGVTGSTTSGRKGAEAATITQHRPTLSKELKSTQKSGSLAAKSERTRLPSLKKPKKSKKGK